jgi:hypothetical protein
MRKQTGRQALVHGTLIFELLLATGCASVPPRTGLQPSNVRVFGAEETRLALPLLGRCDGVWSTGIESVWSPSAHDAARVTRAVGVVLRNSSEDELSGFRLQYFGVVRGTVREILVNAYHEDFVPPEAVKRTDQDWATSAVVFCDGGRATFQAEYDMESERLGPIRFGRSF